MVTHTCPICSKEFNKKSSYNDHVNNKKKPCKPKEDNNAKITQDNVVIPPKVAQKSQKAEFLIDKNKFDIQKTIICMYCNLTFARKDNLTKHIKKSCKVKKLEDEKKQNIFNNLVEKENNKLHEEIIAVNKKVEEIVEVINKKNEEEKIRNKEFELEKKRNKELEAKNKELEKKINDILKKNSPNITNNTQINNINNINITPYKINPFGKECFDKLDKKDVLKIMTDIRNNGKFCFNKLIDLIHFNIKIPENHNIYMGDYNRGKFMFFDGTSWNLNQNEEYVIFEVLEHVRNLFNEYNDEEFELKLRTDRNFRENFNTTFKKYYDYIYDEIEDEELNDNELKKKNNFKKLMNTEVKNRLYNKRQIPIDTFEKLRSPTNTITTTTTNVKTLL